jgi:hypothetical protein
MSSRYWTFIANLIPGQTARSEQVNAKFGEVEEGFDAVAAEMNRSIRFTDGTPGETTFQVPFTPAQRASKVLGFDAGGNLTVSGASFIWKGDWVSSTFYAVNDVIRAPLSENYSIYVCTAAHTATTFAQDIAQWSMMIDLAEARESLILHTLVLGPQPGFPLVAGQDVMVDVSAGPVTLVLPINPAIEDQPINVMHVGGLVGNNPITISGNGNRIMGLTENMIVDTSNASFGLAFCNASLGWRIRGV